MARTPRAPRPVSGWSFGKRQPANHGLGPNDVERFAPPGPPGGEPNPKKTIEAPELRSLRLAAEQGELLPQRQVLEREVSATSERCAHRAQQSEDEGHCSPWLARRGPIVQSQHRVLANDKFVSRRVRQLDRRRALLAEEPCARLARRVKYAPQRMDHCADGSRMEAATLWKAS
jgi:hypothetical protein